MGSDPQLMDPRTGSMTCWRDIIPMVHLNYRVGLAVLFVSQLALSVPVHADVKVTVRNSTYRVHGSTIQSVVKAMKHGGPHSDNHGRRALALADYRYSTRLQTERRNGLCRVKRADVRMTIYFILPQLSASARLSKNHKSRWKRIYSMIRNHENRHGRYYRQFANELHHALTRMKPMKNCSALFQTERKIRRRLEQRNQNRNSWYDRAQYKQFNTRLKRLAPPLRS